MTSKPLYENAFILRKPKVVNFADIIKILTIIKKTFEDSKNVKRIRNYVFKCNLHLCFLVYQNLQIFGEKNNVSRTQVVYHVIYIFFGSSLGNA